MPSMSGTGMALDAALNCPGKPAGTVITGGGVAELTLGDVAAIEEIFACAA